MVDHYFALIIGYIFDLRIF